MTYKETTDQINYLLKKVDKGFEQTYSGVESDLLRGYKRVLESLKKQIADLVEKDQFNEIEMRKFNRLTNLQKQIAKEISELTKVEVNTLQYNVKNVFKDSYINTGKSFNDVLGLDFEILPKESIKYVAEDNAWLDLLKQKSAKLISDSRMVLETALRSNARQEVIQGLAEGMPYAKVTKLLKDKFDIAASRAKAITFTEMHKSHSKGRIEGINKAAESAKNLGLETETIWKHNPVGKPRLNHLALDGKPADSNGYFHVGGVLMTAPGVVVGGNPDNVAKEIVNCHCSAQIRIKGI